MGGHEIRDSILLLSCLPVCRIIFLKKLAEYVRDLGFTPEQVQDFYPTPSTLSAVFRIPTTALSMLLASMILSKRPDQTFRAVTYKVHSSGHFEAFQHQFSVCRILVLHQSSLYCFFMGVLRHIYLLTCKRMDSRIVHTESFDEVQESCKQRTGAGRPQNDRKNGLGRLRP